MNPAVKLGTVALGYVVAFAVASIAVAVRVANTSGPEAQASSGMYAFGDLVVFCGVFGVVALIPTALALYWLRTHRPFWLGLSALGVVIAATGVAAAVLFALGRQAVEPSPLAIWAAFSVLRILAAPGFAVAFLLAAVLAPFSVPRFAFSGAAAAEAAVTAYGGLVWFVL
jgi:hypothetical protein